MLHKGRLYYKFPRDDEGAVAEPKEMIDEVGGKALSLLKASSTFPVPCGFVLTVRFSQEWHHEVISQMQEWKDFVSTGELVMKDHCDAIINACQSRLGLSQIQKEHLDEAFRDVFGEAAHGVTVSVRSSSPEEDLSSTSFAGGYHTTLGVSCTSSRDDTLRDAIIASYASMYDYRVVSYKLRNGVSILDPRIAVIVQKQINSQRSRVAFSINPSNNCYDEVMISANFGLGESVVSGNVTPDVWVVDLASDEPTIVSTKISDKAQSIWLNRDGSGTQTRENDDPNEPALSKDQIIDVADLTTRVEIFFRQEEEEQVQPIDIEWAYDEEGKLYLLQARPVTSFVPLFPELVTKRGEEKNLYLDVIVLSQGFSDPMSVLGLDFWGSMLKAVKPAYSLEGAGGIVWHIHGREYLHLSNFMKSTGGRAQIDSVFRKYDKAIDCALDSINLDEYIPSTTPPAVKGLLWKQLKQVSCGNGVSCCFNLLYLLTRFISISLFHFILRIEAGFYDSQDGVRITQRRSSYVGLS